MEYNKENLDGWALPREAFEWINENLPHGSTILELGSGNGTKELVKYYNVISLEEDKKWVDVVPESNYIYSPLEKCENPVENSCCWYGEDSLKKIPKEYDLLIIDGPKGYNRGNIKNFIHLFKSDIPIIIDDTQRGIDKEMALHLSKQLNKKPLEIKGWEKEMIILI